MLSVLRIVIEKVNGLKVLLWGSKDLLKPRRKGSVYAPEAAKCLDYYAIRDVIPPSTTKLCPVIYLASSEARNKAA